MARHPTKVTTRLLSHITTDPKQPSGHLAIQRHHQSIQDGPAGRRNKSHPRGQYQWYEKCWIWCIAIDDRAWTLPVKCPVWLLALGDLQRTNCMRQQRWFRRSAVFARLVYLALDISMQRFTYDMSFDVCDIRLVLKQKASSDFGLRSEWRRLTTPEIITRISSPSQGNRGLKYALMTKKDRWKREEKPWRACSARLPTLWDFKNSHVLDHLLWISYGQFCDVK